MWFDRWDIKGPLSDIIPKRVWYEEIFSDNEKVADMIDRGVWIWPNSWKHRFPILGSINVPQLSNKNNDKVLWLNLQNEKKEFSTKQACYDLRGNADRWNEGEGFTFTFVLQMRLLKAIMGKAKEQIDVYD
ncbi:hypothetical protein Tco_0273668 [Tanacetum coccineum]